MHSEDIGLSCIGAYEWSFDMQRPSGTELSTTVSNYWAGDLASVWWDGFYWFFFRRDTPRVWTGITKYAGFHHFKFGQDLDGFGFLEIDGVRWTSSESVAECTGSILLEFYAHIGYTPYTDDSLVIDNLRVSILSGTEP